jgi:hypothetical protein
MPELRVRENGIAQELKVGTFARVTAPVPIEAALAGSPFTNPKDPLFVREALSLPANLCCVEGSFCATAGRSAVTRTFSSPEPDGSALSSCGLAAPFTNDESASVSAPEFINPLPPASSSDALVSISRNDVSECLAGTGVSRAKPEVVAVDAIRTPIALHVARQDQAQTARVPAGANCSFHEISGLIA